MTWNWLQQINEIPLLEKIKFNRPLYFLLYAVLIFCIYGRTYDNEYSIDSEYYVNSQLQQGIRAIPDILSTTLLEHDGRSGSYRAVTRCVYAVEYEIFGPNEPGISHLINVFLYLVIAVLAHLILTRFDRLKEISVFLALLIFIVHPVHVEVVASLKNRDILLSVMFAFLAILSALRYSKTGHWTSLLAVPLCYLLSIGSKETTYSFTVLTPVLMAASMPVKHIKWKRIILVFMLMAGTIATLWLILWCLVPNLVLFHVTYKEAFWQLEHPMIFLDNKLEYTGTAMNSLFAYMKLFFYPHPLSFFYGVDTVPIESLFRWRPLLSVAVHSAILILSIVGFRSRNPLSIAGLFYLITLFTYSNILIPIPGIFAERYFFVPSLGACIAAGYLFTWLIRRIHGKTLVIPALLFSVLIVGGAIKSNHRAGQWKDRITTALVDASNNPRAYMLAAYVIKARVEQLEAGRLPTDEREEAMQQVLYYSRELINNVPHDTRTYVFALIGACAFDIPKEKVIDDTMLETMCRSVKPEEADILFEMIAHWDCNQEEVKL